MQGYKRLPMGGIPNLRDLGGWAVPGGMTRYGVFLRSAVPRALSPEDADFLREYGLRTVLDFRSLPECERVPDPLGELEWIRYEHIPMFDSAAAGAALRIRPEAEFTWAEHYIRMAEEQKDWMAAVLHALARAEGCALFHCTTGKDRAGLVSALVLSLCGVCPEDVTADYCVSQVYLREMYAEMESGQKLCGGDLDCPFYSTAPGTMRAFLAYLRERYGGAAGYLAACGLDSRDAEAIRARLCGKI